MRWIVTALVACCALLPGCVRTPMPDAVTGVPVDEVVRRLKCELVTAVDTKRREDPRFDFLTQWAARVHLTLVVDDTASINPGATFIEPLAVANTSRSLGVGGGLTTEAVRTEDIEFFLSFPEMFREMSVPFVWQQNYDFCRRDDGLLLESELGLKALLDKALAPVGAGILYTGKNNPGIGGGQPKVPAGEVGNIQTALNNLNGIERLPHPPLSVAELNETVAGKKVQDLGKAIESFHAFKELSPTQQAEQDKKAKDQKTLSDNLSKAKQLEADTRLIVKEVVTPLYDIATSSIASSCQKSVTKDKYAAVTSGSVVAIKKYAVDNTEDPVESTKLVGEEGTAAKEAYDHAVSMLKTIKDCGPPEKAKPTLYDPLDVIGETVNFYITATGSVTPMWKLVRINAPLATTFMSGTRKDTDTMILALGRPSPAAGSTSSPSSKPMDNQILSGILSQAINNSVANSIAH
jgi:hypothetical protein